MEKIKELNKQTHCNTVYIGLVAVKVQWTIFFSLLSEHKR